METPSFTPHDWIRPLSGYRPAGWIEGFGLLAGVGAIPLLAGQRVLHWPWLEGWYWLVSLAAGLLMAGAGLGYLVRYRRQTGEASPLPANDLSQAALLIILGVFTLLPALAVPLLRLADLANTCLATAYLGGPALLLWAAFESLACYAGWRSLGSGRAGILGLARSGSQALAGLLLWVYLDLTDRLAWSVWLFWIAAVLVLLSVLAEKLIMNGGSHLYPTPACSEAGVGEIVTRNALQAGAEEVE